MNPEKKCQAVIKLKDGTTEVFKDAYISVQTSLSSVGVSVSKTGTGSIKIWNLTEVASAETLYYTEKEI